MKTFKVTSGADLEEILKVFPNAVVDRMVDGWLVGLPATDDEMVNPSNQRHLEDMVTILVGSVLTSAAQRIERIAETTTNMAMKAMLDMATPLKIVGPAREQSIIAGPAELRDRRMMVVKEGDPALNMPPEVLKKGREMYDREAFGRAAYMMEMDYRTRVGLGKIADGETRRKVEELADSDRPEPIQHLTIEYDDRRVNSDTDRFESHYIVFLNCDQNGKIVLTGPLPHQRAQDFATGFQRGYDPVGKLHILDHEAVPHGGVPKVILPLGHPMRDDTADPNSPAAMAIRASMGLPVVMPEGELGAR